MIESGGPTLRHSVPVLFESRAEVDAAVEQLRQFGVASIFPILTEAGDGSERVLALIGSGQLGALCQDPAAPRDLVLQTNVPPFAGIRFHHAFRLASAPTPFRPAENDLCEYWNSRWSFDGPIDVGGLWRVRPNLRRDRIRGEFVSVLSPEAYLALGQPAYAIVVNPYFPANRLPTWVVVESGLPEEEPHHHTIYIDRTIRETLGVADGEFCQVYPWATETVTETFRRWTNRKSVGPRTLVAHVKMPLKSDTEKPVCRMSSGSLSALGIASGGFVTLEAMTLATPAGAEEPPRWAVKRIRRRVLEVDEETTKRRASWESDQAPSYVDCAGRYAIFPPYPDIYLDFFARRELGGLAICGVVQVRAAVWSRLLDEASEFAWLGVIAVIAAATAAISPPAWDYFAIAGALTAILIFWRVRRAVR
ncbi:MAG TPA: hypothetical protein VID29_06890 [Solirubrobacteraceae bacterium]